MGNEDEYERKRTDRAKGARRLYWEALGEFTRADQEPSAESLRAWRITIDALDRNPLKEA